MVYVDSLEMQKKMALKGRFAKFKLGKVFGFFPRTQLNHNSIEGAHFYL